MGRNKGDGTVVIDTVMDTSGAKKGLSSLEGQAGRLNNAFKNIGATVGKLGKLFIAAFAVKKLVAFGKECLELGSDLQEVQNVVDNVFTTMSEKVTEFAQSAASMYGLSETMAKQFTGTFGAMAKAFGFTEKEAYDMSTTLTGLAGDVASFYNIDQEAAFTKLKSVFSGETESLKDLGIVMTQSALDQYALANGFGKTTSKMSEQEKVALRYRFVLDQLSTASGDFSRTSDGWANQVRILKLQIDSLKATIGQGLINLFTPIIKGINWVLGKLATLANAFKSFTELITGKKSSGVTNATAAGLEAEMMAGLADDTGNAADATLDLADAQKDNAKATKAARKEQDKYLSGLDEIRRYESAAASDYDTGSGSGAGSAVGSTVGIPAAKAISPVDYGEVAKGETELEKLGGVLDNIYDKLKSIGTNFTGGFWEGIGGEVNVKVKIQDITNDLIAIKDSLIDIFTDPDVLNSSANYFNQLIYYAGQVTGALASMGLTIGRLFVGAIAIFLQEQKDRIKNHIITMFDVRAEILQICGETVKAIANIFDAFGGESAQKLLAKILGIVFVAGTLVQALAEKLIRDILNIITKPLIENQEEIKKAIEGTLEVYAELFDGVLSIVSRIADELTEFYDKHISPFFESISNGISEIVNTITNIYNTYILPNLEDAARKFKELADGPVGQAVSTIVDALGDIIDAAKELWENILVPFFSFLATVGTIVLGVISAVLQAVVLTALEGVANFINNVFGPAWESFTTWVSTTLGPIITNIGNWFRSLKNTALKTLATYLNGAFTKAWNAIHDLLNGPIATAVGAIKEVFSAFYTEVIQPLGTYVGETLLNAWTSLKDYWEKDLGPKLEALHKAFNEFKENVLKPLVLVVQKTLLNAWKKITKFFGGDAYDKTVSLTGAFSYLWTDILEPLAGFITDTLSLAFSGIETVLSGLISFITNIFAGEWSTAWDSVVGAFGTIWDGLVDIVKTPLRKVISVVNTIINAINSAIGGIESAFTFDIPVAVPEYMQGGGIGASQYTISNWAKFPRIPNIDLPFLAKGAVIPPKAPFAAVLGDQRNGTNLEAPEGLLRQIVREETGGTGNGQYRFMASINRRVLFDELITEAKLRQSQSGRNPFEMG